MEIIAYTYEADDHCIACTKERYDANGFDKAPQDYPYYNGDGVDEHGVGYDSLDYESNYVHPRFATDEWQELDKDFLAENPTQHLACGDCHGIIKTYTIESEVTACDSY